MKRLTGNNYKSGIINLYQHFFADQELNEFEERALFEYREKELAPYKGQRIPEEVLDSLFIKVAKENICKSTFP